nr:hypothetical protein [Candidatus Sigynarchaeota archaeon]
MDGIPRITCMEDIQYRFSLERFHAGAYNYTRKKSVTVVFPTLYAEHGYSEDDFDRIVNDIIHYFFFERVCLELRMHGIGEYRFCRKFRHSRCRCEYISRMCMRTLNMTSLAN